MSDYFEIDFLEVKTKKSGDAIGVRYELGGETFIHVVDGGYRTTGGDMVQHVKEYYGNPSFIDHVVLTHPDQDHAAGIQEILENFAVGALWMFIPWNYVDVLINRFDRYTNPESLKRKLREAYPYIEELEKVAKKRGIPIYEPVQGAQIGAFTVLAPSRSRYLDLVVTSARTPQEAAHDSLLVKAESFVMEALRKARTFIQAAWGEENFPSSGTSNENEMSVIQFARLCGNAIVLTADAGCEGLAEAADYAPYVGLILPGGVDRFQVPHHGGRHNLSTEILDRWFGAPLRFPPAKGFETFSAIVSAAREDEDHPRKVVVRAFKHRGAVMVSTDDGSGTKQTSYNAPARNGWGPATPLPYPDEMEE